jgi:hypothetical protein
MMMMMMRTTRSVVRVDAGMTTTTTTMMMMMMMRMIMMMMTWQLGKEFRLLAKPAPPRRALELSPVKDLWLQEVPDAKEMMMIIMMMTMMMIMMMTMMTWQLGKEFRLLAKPAPPRRALELSPVKDLWLQEVPDAKEMWRLGNLHETLVAPKVGRRRRRRRRMINMIILIIMMAVVVVVVI